MKMRKTLQGVPVLACAGVMAACSGGGDSAPTGTLSVSLMDRPIDGVAELWVTITEVWIKPSGNGAAEQLQMTTTPLTVNLLELDDENASILVSEAVVDAGSYNWIEFKVADGVDESWAIRDDGGLTEVDIAVQSDSVRLVSGFEVGPNQALRLLFDWDVRKGLTDAVGREAYMLRPAFRMLDADEYGAISGSITIDGANTECAAIGDATEEKIVYVFDGIVSPDEIDDIDPNPVTTADATLSMDVANDYDYRVVVMPGTYTVALACNGADDTNATDGGITFVDPVVPGSVVVTADVAVDGVDF